MTVEMRNDEQNDQFPVGMRVLAVDDDHTCLRLIELLLRKCQYHVTTRDRAIDALKLLRENRDDFDLVISDVQMPDMDGFKLLELVGLEMDLPVIMLSTNGDTKMVMKGITHGACDYLLKPVRLEELKNIWQHVLRRKTTDKKGQTNSDNREKRSSPTDEEQNCLRACDSDNDGRHGKRRKDQNEEDEEEYDEENDEDSSSQKKARVVWSVELHRKFVSAVNQLGFERAVPKKILELMNVDKLSRENVASHLQKYRLYLKRLSSVANQQANMVAALGGADSPYLRMNPMGFHNFNGNSSFPSSTFRPLPPAGMLGRLNSSVGLSSYGISPSGTAPLGHTQMSDSSKFQLPRDQTGNILQGMPTSLEFDQLQIPLKKYVAGVTGDFSSPNQASGHFPVSNGNNPLLLQNHSSGPGFGFTGPNRNTASWPLQSSGAQSTSYGSSQVGYAQTPLSQAFNSGNNGSSLALNGANELQIPPNNSRFDARCEAVDLSSGGAQNMGFASKPLWSNHKLTTVHHPEFTNNSVGACLSSPIGNQTNMNFGGSNELGFIGHNPNMNSSSAYHMTAAVPGIGSATNSGALAVNGAGSLEDVVTSMIKWEQEGSTVNKGSDLSSYPLRTCI